jgi:uncharacterized protein YtpQ (UPF0354 family)
MLRRSDEQSLQSKLRYGSSVEFVDRPFPSASVCLSIVYDLPEKLMRLDAQWLERWGVSAELAWEAVMHNLRLRSADNWMRVHPRVFTSNWNDGFGATRCLFSDLLLRLPLNGRSRIFMIPERDTLIVADTDDADTLALTVDTALQIFERDRLALTPELFELSNGEVRLYPLTGRLQLRVENVKSIALGKTI